MKKYWRKVKKYSLSFLCSAHLQHGEKPGPCCVPLGFWESSEGWLVSHLLQSCCLGLNLHFSLIHYCSALNNFQITPVAVCCKLRDVLPGSFQQGWGLVSFKVLQINSAPSLKIILFFLSVPWAPFAVMCLIAVCYRAVRRLFWAKRGDKAGAQLWKMQLEVCRCSFHWIKASFVWRLAISYLTMLFWDEAEGGYKVEQRFDASCNGQSDSQAHSLFLTDSFLSQLEIVFKLSLYSSRIIRTS